MEEHILQFFAYQHLPEHLQAISKPFSEQADHIVKTIPRSPERTAGLRKLLEAKDCIVRAFLGENDTLECGGCGHKIWFRPAKEKKIIFCEACGTKIIIMSWQYKNKVD